MHSWLYIPAGIVLILLVCFGVECLLRLAGGGGAVPFPSSVAGLVALFLALLLSERVLGEHRTRRFVAVLDVPVNKKFVLSHPVRAGAPLYFGTHTLIAFFCFVTRCIRVDGRYAGSACSSRRPSSCFP